VTLAEALSLPGHEGVRRLSGKAVREAFEEDPDALRRASPAAWLAAAVEGRVRAKLAREPVEDFRIDFEDGFGHRSDEEEDRHARRCAEELGQAAESGAMSPFSGIRIKPLNGELGVRALRTLDLFVTTLAKAGSEGWPGGFVVTLPKVTRAEQVELLVDALEALEGQLGLEPASLKLELMIEMPQAIVAPDGTIPLPKLVDASRGRCVAAHFGTYDYTAGCQVTAAHQHMQHPACDHAKHVMQVALAGRGVWLSDGATTVMPVGPHRAGGEAADALSPAHVRDNLDAVHAAWRRAAADIRHSLVGGFYQGWDLHPAQLVARYGTVYGFFLEGLEAAGARLRNFVDKAAQATLVGDIFDDAATGQGLLNFFLRAMACGAITEDEAQRHAGLSRDELQSRSFVAIMRGRG
jgi:citrate lyase beta subunit